MQAVSRRSFLVKLFLVGNFFRFDKLFAVRLRPFVVGLSSFVFPQFSLPLIHEKNYTFFSSCQLFIEQLLRFP